MSVANKIFDYVLEKLNENTNEVIFDGNYTFKFFPQQAKDVDTFHILKKEDGLEYEPHEVVPFVDVSTVEIPFNTKNKRSDWEIEYYLAFKIDKQKDENGQLLLAFNYESDEYQALMETYNLFKDQLNHQISDIKAAFKVREPQRVSTFFHDGHYYTVFALTFNITKLEKGIFGHEDKIYMQPIEDAVENIEDDEYLLDAPDWTPMSAKTPREIQDLNSEDKYYDVEKRSWEATITANYNERAVDKLLLKEAMAIGSNNNKYRVRFILEGVYNETRIVKIYDPNAPKLNNVPQTVTFTMRLAEV